METVSSKVISSYKPLLALPQFTLEQKDTSTLIELSEDKKNIFVTRIMRLFSKNDSMGRLIYRGTNVELLKKTLCSDSTPNDEEHLYANLFYFGDKAAYYVNENRNMALASSTDSLFDSLHKQLSPERQNKRKDVREFCAKEKSVASFFCDITNKQKFKDALQQHQTLIYYYLALSHTLGVIEKNPSRCKSTTTKIANAIKFACRLKSNEKIQNFPNEIGNNISPVVLLYALPNDLRKIQFSTQSFIDSYSSEINRLLFTNCNLPYCKESYCYNEQYEITVYGALMPHLLWGVYDITNNRVIVNPYMFTEQSMQNSNITLWLHIDQSEFTNRLRQKTNFWNYASYLHQKGMIDGEN